MKKILLLLLFIAPLTLQAQNTYTQCQTFFRDGQTVYFFQNDKMLLYLKGYEAKQAYNPKEFFVEVVIKPLVDLINFDPSKITANYEAKGKEKVVEFYSYEDYKKKMKRSTFWRGGANEESTNVKSSTSANISTYGSYNSTNVESDTETKVVTKTSREVFNEHMAQNEDWMKGHYLRKNTLQKDQMFGGVVAAKRPSAYPVHLSVEIAGDTYKVDIEKPEE